MNNRYTIQRELGQGGMAIVYLAEDTRLNAQVALKVLRPEFASNGHIHKRFASEAKSMFRMNHPNIIKVTDLIDDGDTVAFVMEYIEGETLKEYLERKGKLGDNEIRSLFTQMLDAVGYVHEQKLVHRDIKPSNFMITPNGKVKLMDFGIAKNTDANSAEYTQTGTGVQMGTPMYMSPEQITETKSVTAQSDIYSLGVVLWQMVTGKRPYDTKTLSSFLLQSKIVTEPLENTNTMWDRIISKATAKQPKDRYLATHDILLSYKIDTNDTDNRSNDFTRIESHSLNLGDTSLDAFNEEWITVERMKVDNKMKCGFINLQGNWIIQPIFDHLSSYDEQGFAQAKLNEKWGCINRQGNWIIQPMFDSIYSFDEQGFAQAKLNEKWGLIDRQGNWIIQPMFDSIYWFDAQGFSQAQLNEKWGLINRQGNWMIQPMFDFIDSFDEQGFTVAKLNEKRGFINRQGNWIIQPMFDGIDLFDEKGFAEAKLNEKWGFINREGNWIIQPIFDNLSSYDEQGFAEAKLNEKWGCINREGNWIIQPIFDFIIVFDEQGFAQAKLNEKWGSINRQGNWIIQPKFDSIYLFDKQGFAQVQLNKKWGSINRQGNWIIQPMFDFIYSFDEQGFAEAELNEKRGFINRQGNWTIQPMFDSIYSFDEQGFAQAKLNEKWGSIDRQGNWVIQPMFDSIYSFDKQGFAKTVMNSKVGYIDRTGYWVIQPIFDEFEESNNDIDNRIISLFENLKESHSIYFRKSIPIKKLNNFTKNYNPEFVKQSELIVYYDDTIFGKGDDGFLILRYEGRLYVFLNIYLGFKLPFCLESDSDTSSIVDVEYNGCKINIQFNSNSELHDIQFIEFKFTQKIITEALFNFLDSFVDRPSIYDINEI
jgi:serine/threonine protein kinase